MVNGGSSKAGEGARTLDIHAGNNGRESLKNTENRIIHRSLPHHDEFASTLIPSHFLA
jgi:hypothetical protein